MKRTISFVLSIVIAIHICAINQFQSYGETEHK